MIYINQDNFKHLPSTSTCRNKGQKANWNLLLQISGLLSSWDLLGGAHQGQMTGHENRITQVWPLTHFFLFPSCKNHWFAMRANRRPFPWAILFSSIPPSNSLAFVSRVVSGTAGIQVCRARHGVPRTPSRTSNANHDCVFVENALLFNDPWLWKVNGIELS